MIKIYAIPLLIYIITGCENTKRDKGYYEEKPMEYVIEKLHTEPRSINNSGAFEMTYYLYMTDGSIHEVDMEDYLASNIGDTVYFQEKIWTSE